MNRVGFSLIGLLIDLVYPQNRPILMDSDHRHRLKAQRLCKSGDGIAVNLRLCL
jgi:hypothetical protein